MMKLPSLDDLNHVAQLMHDMDFVPLPREFKPGVVAIAQQGVLAYVIDELPVDLVVAFETSEHAMTLLARATEIAKQLEEIDTSLGPVMDWFKLSKLYEP